MDETFTTNAIILKRQPFREHDSRVVVFSLDKGKLDLVVRGAQKSSSKLAAHIEPITLSNIMVVKGKKLSYIGGAVGKDFYKNIKEDLSKLRVVGECFSLFLQHVREGRADVGLYELLNSFLSALDGENNYSPSLASVFFKFIFLSQLGYQLELKNCVICQVKILEENNKINFSHGGLICGSCKARDGQSIPISTNAIKVLRLSSGNNLSNLIKIKVEENLLEELCEIVDKYCKYYSNN